MKIIFPELSMTTEQKWSYVRNCRDSLVRNCDWTQLMDAALTFDERTAWQTYRQTLRDIPQDFATPDSVIFPEIPA